MNKLYFSNVLYCIKLGNTRVCGLVVMYINITRNSGFANS